MTILQRYVLKEWFWTFLAVTFVLMIVLLGIFLGEMFNDIADGRMPPGLVGTQMILYLPEALGNVLPLAGFVAIMWGLGRLYRDQEMAVMRASGFHWQQLLRPLLNLTLPVSALLLFTQLAVAPAASALADRKLEEALRTAAVWGLQAGQFHVVQKGELVVYVEALEDEGRTLRKVFVYQVQGAQEQVWMAERGEYWMDPQTGERFITLEDGQITESVAGQLNVTVLGFERNDLLLPEPEVGAQDVKLASVPSTELLALADAPASAELQWRLTPSLLIILLSLLAIPLSHSDPREGRGSRVVMGILIYALYTNLLVLCRSWIAEGVIPPELGLWWAHGLVLVAGLMWLQRQGRMPRGTSASAP